MDNEKKKVLLIVNPCAGKTKSRAATFDLVDKFSKNDYEFAVHTTTCRGDATEIVKKNYEGKDLIVCCGGDGTLNETINGVMDVPSRVPIGYIPTGSTNDLATTLGISTDIDKATDLIMSGKLNSYDVGLLNNRYFSYVAAFGALTRASYATSQKLKNKIGHLAYILSGFAEWKNIKPVHMKIEYDGGVIEDDVRLNDGLFEILLVRKVKAITAPIVLGKVIRQKYDGEQILFLKTSKVKLTSPEEVPWTLDGEYGGSHKMAMINVLSKAIEICSPENPLFENDILPEPAASEQKDSATVK